MPVFAIFGLTKKSMFSRLLGVLSSARPINFQDRLVVTASIFLRVNSFTRRGYRCGSEILFWKPLRNIRRRRNIPAYKRKGYLIKSFRYCVRCTLSHCDMQIVATRLWKIHFSEYALHPPRSHRGAHSPVTKMGILVLDEYSYLNAKCAIN